MKAMRSSAASEVREGFKSDSGCIDLMLRVVQSEESYVPARSMNHEQTYFLWIQHMQKQCDPAERVNGAQAASTVMISSATSLIM